MSSRNMDNVLHLYEFFCEVSPVSPKGKIPRITYKYPADYGNEPILYAVPQFVYPYDFEISGVNHFSFIMTAIDSKWLYGFCRHDPNTHSALTMVSKLPYHDVFFRLLDSVAEVKEGLDPVFSNEPLVPIAENSILDEPPEFERILRSIYERPPPSKQPYSLPSIPHNVNLTEYYSAVDVRDMIAMLAALLNERRIIVASKKPSRLTACVQAANDLLYPLVWQHIYIPILPASLSEYLLAPMPYLIGVPHEILETMQKSDVGDVVTLDADTGLFKSPFNDMDHFPSEVSSLLRKTFKKQHLIGEAIPRAFLRAMVQILGGYKTAFSPNGRLQFDRNIFINSRGTFMKPFLDKLNDMQIFQQEIDSCMKQLEDLTFFSRQFIDERVALYNSSENISDEFEKECEIYDEKISHLTFGHKALLGAKKLGTGTLIPANRFFRHIKEKAHPAMESAAQSVRTGKKGVQSAFRGLFDHHTHNDRPNMEMNVPFSHTHRMSDPLRISKFYPKSSTIAVVNDLKEDSPIYSDDSIQSPILTSTKIYDNRSATPFLTPSKPNPARPVREQQTDVSMHCAATQTSFFDSSCHSVPRTNKRRSLNRTLRDTNSPSTSPINMGNTSANDLMQFQDNASSRPPQDEDLLSEYGLDLKDFNISRCSWTTFE